MKKQLNLLITVSRLHHISVNSRLFFILIYYQLFQTKLI